MTEHQSKDHRREQILDAAAELFASKGFEKTSVDEIAKAAGLSKGAIYWYFPSKESILIGLAEKYQSQNQTTVVESASEDMYGPEAVYKAHRHIYAEKANNPIPDLLFRQFVSMGSKHPEIADALARSHCNWVDLITGLLDDAVAKGYFKHFDTRLVSEAISAMYGGTCITKYDSPDRAVQIVEYACKLFYDALVTDLRIKELAAQANGETK
ncbi:MAG: TetR/AcrR family transcriptional regulator [bacterium]|nr:TetR/AcrR family transcriptional regulator [bacterium]